MKNIGVLAALAILLSGCASFQPTLPDDYQGPTATIQDTEQRLERGKANLFYLERIDGKRIKSSRTESLSASYGQGDSLETVLLKNCVPAQRQVFTIVGRTTYAMPMRAMTGTVYEIKGDVDFTPEAGRSYAIKGYLSEDRAAVWLEERVSGKVIEKFELEGDAELGFFEK